MHRILVLSALFALGMSCAEPSGGPPKSSGKVKSVAGPRSAVSGLDTALVKALYMDGEFDSAINLLEQARQRGHLRTTTDSVFAFKYLSVMYAATYATVEKGKQFMVLLLRIDPSAGILDLHASDIIYMIFRNVQTEMGYSLRVPKQDPEPVSLRDTSAAASDAPRSRSLYWTAGSAVAAAGIGAILFFTLYEPERREGTNYQGGIK